MNNTKQNRRRAKKDDKKPSKETKQEVPNIKDLLLKRSKIRPDSPKAHKMEASPACSL
jgi:hypothetical protein